MANSSRWLTRVMKSRQHHRQRGPGAKAGSEDHGDAVHPARCAAARHRQRELPDVAGVVSCGAKLENEWKCDKLASHCRTVSFAELPTVFDAHVKGAVTGRVVVRGFLIASAGSLPTVDLVTRFRRAPVWIPARAGMTAIFVGAAS